MFNGKVRLQIIVEGTPMAVRFVPHNTDPTKVMVKGQGEAPAAFCKAAGIEFGPLTQGSQFTMCEAKRADVGAGVATIIDQIMEAATPTQQLAAAPKQLGAKSSCEECGCDDGTHFNFCPHHG